MVCEKECELKLTDSEMLNIQIMKHNFVTVNKVNALYKYVSS